MKSKKHILEGFRMANSYENRKAYFIGGGIASLSGAVFLIRDANFPGENIHILEETRILGGSNDGAGDAERGYVIRGGRMLNDETYENTWDMLSSIPSIDNRGKSVRDDIAAFDKMIQTHANARLVNKDGEILDVSSMGFDNMDRMAMAKLIVTPEEKLGKLRINQCFGPHFFETNFWYMWATTFAFQPWHSAVELKRYMLRFMHEYSRIQTLEGVTRTPYNQHDSLTLPLHRYLEGFGVHFDMGYTVTDLDFKASDAEKTVEKILYIKDGKEEVIAVKEGDLVFFTNGSMTEGYSLGSMTKAPALGGKGSSWTLWEKLAKKDTHFGNPEAFAGNIQESKWESFTVTCQDARFFERMEKFSRNKPGTGALVTFKDSNWLMSVVLAYQPHFRNQPENVKVFWGYGLFPDQEGNFIKKKMSDCTGEEILTELLHHLKFEEDMEAIIKTANCIPCMMPFITSQFMPRTGTDRPQVVPQGCTNLAFISQFCEIPEDVVFTEEYSVRAARMAVYKLLKLDREVLPINKHQYDVRILLKGLVTSLR
jgi:oleate hydratase